MKREHLMVTALIGYKLSHWHSRQENTDKTECYFRLTKHARYNHPGMVWGRQRFRQFSLFLVPLSIKYKMVYDSHIHIAARKVRGRWMKGRHESSGENHFCLKHIGQTAVLGLTGGLHNIISIWHSNILLLWKGVKCGDQFSHYSTQYAGLLKHCVQGKMIWPCSWDRRAGSSRKKPDKWWEPMIPL